ncbi:hypothetical protein [Thalassiella azotivora]
MSDDAIGQASEQYDRAEQTYMSALAAGADDATLRTLAKQVAKAAQAVQSADDAAAAPLPGIARYYDVPEVLSTLWRDLSEAYDRRVP